MNTSFSMMPERNELSKKRQTIHKAMSNPDEYALRLDYIAESGQVTNRTISPVRFEGRCDLRVLALCLGREQPRSFDIRRMSNLTLVSAADLLMPEPIEVQS